MCDQFEYLSGIRGHRIYTKIFYAHAPLERHSWAENNPTMTLLVLRGQTLACGGALSFAVYKHPVGTFTASDKRPS